MHLPPLHATRKIHLHKTLCSVLWPLTSSGGLGWLLAVFFGVAKISDSECFLLLFVIRPLTMHMRHCSLRPRLITLVVTRYERLCARKCGFSRTNDTHTHTKVDDNNRVRGGRGVGWLVLVRRTDVFLPCRTSRAKLRNTRSGSRVLAKCATHKTQPAPAAVNR